MPKTKPPRAQDSRRFFTDLYKERAMKVILSKQNWKFLMFLFSKETPLNSQGAVAAWGCAALLVVSAVAFAFFPGISLYKYLIGG